MSIKPGGRARLVHSLTLEELKAFAHTLPFQSAVVDRACRLVYANRPWRDQAEAVRGPLLLESAFVYFDEQDPGFVPGCRQAVEAVEGVREVATGRRELFELDHPAPPFRGAKRWTRLTALTAGVSPRAALLLRQDCTEHQADRDRLRLYQFALERGPGFCLWLDSGGRIGFANDRLCRVLGYTRNELCQLAIWDIDPYFREADWPEHLRELRDLGVLVFQSLHLTKQGGRIAVEATSNYYQAGDQELVMLFSREPEAEPSSGSYRFQRKVEERTSELAEANRRLQEEIESRQEIEAALRESRERVALALWGTNLGLWDWYVDTGRLTFDSHWAAMVGYDVEELDPSLDGWLGLVHPDDEVALRRALEDHLHGLTEGYEIAHRLNHRGGEYRWFLARGKIAERTVDGSPLRVTGTLQDVTDRRRLEDQLLQSQKMEAVGQLAGGVAHDFNNLLTAINGYADLVLRTLSEDDALHGKVSEIRKAGDRAATLTDRLLAFSRKQLLQPEVLDLNQVIADMEALLGPAVGEGIEVVTDLGKDLPMIKADRGQMEQVLLNLAVNARDAMPAGGRLSITTQRADLRELPKLAIDQPLRDGYVLVSVADSGIGIESHNLERVFEPFFTTKDPGQGTGLGLSMVYGIVRQSGGLIDLVSRVGKGTTVRILLPIAATDVTAPSRLSVEVETVALGGDETILLVEDEDAVRELVRSSLEDQGYRLFVAESAEDARHLLMATEGGPEIEPELLITDVLLPGRNGAELATELRHAMPELKVLFVSGYARDALGRAQILAEDVNFLQKPFSIQHLLQHVRALLDQPE